MRRRHASTPASAARGWRSDRSDHQPAIRRDSGRRMSRWRQRPAARSASQRRPLVSRCIVYSGRRGRAGFGPIAPARGIDWVPIVRSASRVRRHRSPEASSCVLERSITSGSTGGPCCQARCRWLSCGGGLAAYGGLMSSASMGERLSSPQNLVSNNQRLDQSVADGSNTDPRLVSAWGVAVQPAGFRLGVDSDGGAFDLGALPTAKGVPAIAGRHDPRQERRGQRRNRRGSSSAAPPWFQVTPGRRPAERAGSSLSG